MKQRSRSRIDYLERASRALSLIVLAAAVSACLVAPLLAINFSHQPFPGFLVEPTLVVNESGNAEWPGWAAGVRYPQRIERIAGQGVGNPAEFAAALNGLTAGTRVSILARLPDGSARVYPDVTIIDFPGSDMLRMFVLPYLVGLAYLVIGIWIYRVRGDVRPGRALAYFCFSATLVCCLLFDLSSTHVGPGIWTLAVAQLGGALVSLSMRFPQEWKPVARRPWVLGLPYGISTALAVWGLLALNWTREPWAYISAWDASYRFVGFGMIMFLATTAYWAWRSRSPVVRQQARIVLLGSVLAFVPLAIWTMAPLVELGFQFNGILLLPSLILFPLSVSIAILRYRLLEADTIVNRTIVYGTLTAVLAGVFTAAVTVMQKLFVMATGEKSDAALVITTLIVAAVFQPLKVALQKFVDRHFGQALDTTYALRGFGSQVQSYIQMSDAEQITRRLLEEAATALGAESGALNLLVHGRLRTVHTFGYWRGDAWLSLPLESDGERYGLLMLGPRTGGHAYTRAEAEALQQVAREVAHAVRLAVASQSLSGLAATARAEQPAVDA